MAQRLELFLQGQILHKDFASEPPHPTNDDGVIGIWEVVALLERDSFRGFRGAADMPNVLQASLQRCIVFLSTDLEYCWPRERHMLWDSILFCGFGFALLGIAIAGWSKRISLGIRLGLIGLMTICAHRIGRSLYPGRKGRARAEDDMQSAWPFADVQQLREFCRRGII